MFHISSEAQKDIGKSCHQSFFPHCRHPYFLPPSLHFFLWTSHSSEYMWTLLYDNAQLHCSTWISVTGLCEGVHHLGNYVKISRFTLIFITLNLFLPEFHPLPPLIFIFTFFAFDISFFFISINVSINESYMWSESDNVCDEKRIV